MRSPRPLAAGLSGAAVALVLGAGPAYAAGGPNTPLEGFNTGPGLSVAETIGLFVVIPAVILFAVWGLALLPDLLANRRYRPARGWQAPAVWFAGPPDPTSAVAAAEAGDEGRGGAGGTW